MRVLVTRPAEQAQGTAEALERLGHNPLVAPLLAIRLIEHPELSFDNVQAIVVTSANAVRALARLSAPKSFPMFAVGRRTAEAARCGGFSRVMSADADADALAAMVAANANPAKGSLLYAAGTDTAGDLAGALARSGFSVRRSVLYEAIAAPALPQPLRAALAAHAIDAALFFSPRSAEIFASLVMRAGLPPSCCQRLIACCISSAVADRLGTLAFADTRVAARPNQDGVLALLGPDKLRSVSAISSA